MAEGMIMTHVLFDMVGVCFVCEGVAASGAGAAPLWGDYHCLERMSSRFSLQKDVPWCMAVRSAAVFLSGAQVMKQTNASGDPDTCAAGRWIIMSCQVAHVVAAMWWQHVVLTNTWEPSEEAVKAAVSAAGMLMP